MVYKVLLILQNPVRERVKSVKTSFDYGRAGGKTPFHSSSFPFLLKPVFETEQNKSFPMFWTFFHDPASSKNFKSLLFSSICRTDRLSYIFSSARSFSFMHCTKNLNLNLLYLWVIANFLCFTILKRGTRWLAMPLGWCCSPNIMSLSGVFNTSIQRKYFCAALMSLILFS